MEKNYSCLSEEQKKLVKETVINLISQRIPNKSDQEAVMEDTYEKIINGLHAYTERGQLISWVTTIAINACNDYFRKKKAESIKGAAYLNSLDDDSCYEPDFLSKMDDPEALQRDIVSNYLNDLRQSQDDSLDTQVMKALFLNKEKKVRVAEKFSISLKRVNGIIKRTSEPLRKTFHDRFK